MTINSSDLYSLLEPKPWKTNGNSIWLASTLKLYRNISRYFFPGKLDSNGQKQLQEFIAKALMGLSSLEKPMHLMASSLGATEKQYLFEHFLCVESFQEALSNEGFIIDHSGTAFGLINIKEHLQLQVIDTSGALENAWNRLVKIETEAGKTLDFAFSPRFGFLTANPHYCGTGFVAYVYLHLPAHANTNHLLLTLEKEGDPNIIVSGMGGDLSEFPGDIIVLHNRATIGLSEEEICRSLQTFATKLQVAENSLRTHLSSEEQSSVKNLISRAYGLAFHSYKLELKEALSALSLCKLGVDLKWIEGIDQVRLNELIFTCGRGHLMHLLNNQDGEAIAKKRAELFRQSFKEAKLLV